jgi:ABC-type Fe3+ transport system permease subunit
VASFEILPTTIVPSTEPEVTPTNETLPFTGAENGSATAYALVLVVGGLLALVWAKQLQVGRHESSDG